MTLYRARDLSEALCESTTEADVMGVIQVWHVFDKAGWLDLWACRFRLSAFYGTPDLSSDARVRSSCPCVLSLLEFSSCICRQRQADRCAATAFCWASPQTPAMMECEICDGCWKLQPPSVPALSSAGEVVIRYFGLGLCLLAVFP